LRVISQNLNKVHGPFFIFPDNLCCSIRIWQNIPSGVKVRALQSPQNGPRTQNFKIFTFSRGYCAKMLCVSSSEPILFCTSRGPLVIPPASSGLALKFWPQPPQGGPTLKKFSPNYSKILVTGSTFSHVLYHRQNFGNCTLAHFLGKNRRFLELCEKFQLKKVTKCAPSSP